MTDEQINRAIAEACGWEEIEKIPHQSPYLRGKPPESGNWGREIPNYSADLNAMHEVEKNLGNNGAEYRDALCYIVDRDLQRGGNNPVWAIHATARQRAEAFLRTIGRWEEAI